MKKIVTFLLFFTILAFSTMPYEKSFSLSTGINVRVRVASDMEKISLTVNGPYSIEAINSDLVLYKGKNLNKETISPTNSGLKIGQKEFKIYGIRVIPKNDASILIDRSQFRGIVDIIRTENLKLLVVNHLDVEKYLYGVLYHEVPHYWPTETQKAQAVAARTFAMDRIQNMRDRDYDVTSDIYSQVYGGRKSERKKSTKAVDATRGMVLTYKGKIIPAYYHSICAGHTENSKEVFGIDLPPLKGVSCPYCKGARGYNWKAMFSYKQMEGRLNKYGIKTKKIKHISEGRRDASGRLADIKIKDSSGTKLIKSFKFRLALGPNTIKSTKFTIRITRKGVIFRGEGWGHGVGMCQWGAFGMGKRRFNYKMILDFYYPGAKIEKIKMFTNLNRIVVGHT